MRRLFLKMAALAVVGSVVAACGGNDSGDDQTPGTMIEVAARSGEISAVVLAARRAGLEGALSAPDANLTLFAPTNEAFAVLAGQLGFTSIAAMVDALSPEQLNTILSYHVLPAGKLSAADIVAGGPSQNTLLNQGGAAVPLAIDSSSGVKITDSVGRVAIINLTDIPADNGVIHVIDRVLIPPGVLTVLQTVQSNPERFSSLAGLIGAPALVTALNGPGPFTLFAPVNAAFKDIEALLPTLSTENINTVLTYHVVGARVPSSAISFGTPVNTLAGQPFTINAGVAPVLALIDDTTTTDARVTVVDIIASNGVVHVIDKVLLPALN
jgi:uncharacterized surface protein with fasciclin (FAS1) repeats